MKLTTTKVNWSNCPVAVKRGTSKGGVTPLRRNNSIEDWLQCQQGLDTRLVSGSSKGGVTPLRHNNSIEDWLQCQQSLDTRANLGFICSNNAHPGPDFSLTPQCIASPVTAIFKMKLTTAKVKWSNCPLDLAVSEWKFEKRG
ncbi:hypothetical protein CDAR_191941 [Caerostris darwini]|uniref:Uncharacterized protein n=1 Tax=Caerostris darwini TaxID=1538125 RepID=A0AAV4NNU9_9ARAC|nr:hypothetical protein CDAR_191941 [Caerostris darwini]